MGVVSPAGSASIPPSDYQAALGALAHRFFESRLLAVEGPDRAAFLQGQLTQDCRGLVPGQSRPMAGLTPKGKLLYFGTLAAEEGRLLLLLSGRDVSAVAAHLARYAVFQKVSISDASKDLLMLGLYGPAAARIEPPIGTIALPAEGEIGRGFLLPSASRPDIERLLEEAGSAPVSEATAEILRVEAGRPRYGQDADQGNLPDELGLGSAISTTKGCYVGQEIVARLRTYGRVNRRLVGFRFPEGPVKPGTMFPAPDKQGLELARVSSSVLSPRFGPIGLGLAFREVVEGAALRDPSDPARCAVVAAIPFS